MMSDLSKTKCVPCKGDTPPLSKDLIVQYLKEIKDWELKEVAIEKTFVFKDFDEAIVFTNKVAQIANEEDHHPNIFIHGYKYVTVTLTTHVARGLTKNDFIVAAKIDDLDV